MSTSQESSSTTLKPTLPSQVSVAHQTLSNVNGKMAHFISLLQAHPELAGCLHKVSNANNALDQEVTRAYEMSSRYIHPDRKVTESELVNYLVSKNANPRFINRLAGAYLLEVQFREDDKINFGFTPAEAGRDAQTRVAEVLSHGEITSPTLNEMMHPDVAQKNNIINYLKDNAEKSSPEDDPLDSYGKLAPKQEFGFSY